MTLTTLVSGAGAAAREAWIADSIDPSVPTTIILEGLPDGSTRLDALAASPTVQIHRIAPGCLCCTGNLTMRVTLNRVLRNSPQRLFISLATAGHLDRIRDTLLQPPYDSLLSLTQDTQLS
ncbi:hypothetical protein [Noviherbaspirillum massiliense]|uniref:hypothetical protein n=1 Tax=Noviherbaspirillum massiliense TaxID=1465823 RepID=UPI00037588C4|nr:hypothetical protein [Noviherbaspirillum massiliense]